MAEDPRDYIDQYLSVAGETLGREPTADEMAEDFAKRGLTDRAGILSRMRGDDGPLSISEAAKRVRYVSVLRNVHETLRKVDR